MTDRYRVGGKQPGNIYQDDKRFAFCIRDEDGPLVVAALNGAYTALAALTDLPAQVAARRGRDGLSLRELGAATGLSINVLSRFENGRDIRLSTAIKLAEWVAGDGQ
jgi:hypothetical protein